MLPVPTYQPPQQNVVISQSPPTTRQRYDGWQTVHKQGITVLSVIETVAGTICVIFQIALIGLYYSYPRDYESMSGLDGYVGGGIWCGGYFILTGAIGLASLNKKGLGWIIGFMVLNITSSVVFAWTLVGLTAASLGIVNEFCGTDVDWWHHYSCKDSLWKTSLGLNSIMLLMAVLQLIVTITASIYSCLNTCCRPFSGTADGNYPTMAMQSYMVHYPAANGVPQHPGLVTGPPLYPGYVQTALTNNTGQYLPHHAGSLQSGPSAPPAYSTLPQQPPDQHKR